MEENNDLEKFKQEVFKYLNEPYPMTEDQKSNLMKWPDDYWQVLMNDFSPKVAACGIESGLL